MCRGVSPAEDKTEYDGMGRTEGGREGWHPSLDPYPFTYRSALCLRLCLCPALPCPGLCTMRAKVVGLVPGGQKTQPSGP